MDTTVELDLIIGDLEAEVPAAPAENFSTCIRSYCLP